VLLDGESEPAEGVVAVVGDTELFGEVGQQDASGEGCTQTSESRA